MGERARALVDSGAVPREPLDADRRSQPGEEEPSGLQHAPHLGEHAVEVTFVTGEVEDGAADDRVEGAGAPVVGFTVNRTCSSSSLGGRV